jgi:transcriptional regulator with XRE-family HTH domain
VAGLTQEEPAERSGVSVRAIANAESGRTTRPHRGSVQLIARALHLAGPEHAVFCAAGRGLTAALAEELGTEPGSEVRQLHEQILDADPALIRAGPANPAAAASSAGG